ncbi:MAG: hypothetical protein H6Q69_1168 [Firmicutes bacterium]|nr:hypothetical protein [Bacillota bacterium]
MELAEVKFNKYLLIEYNGNEYMILDYFGQKSLYKVCHDDSDQIEFIYIDTIDKIDIEK